MPKFVIEREIPGAGTLSSQELHDISQKSNDVLATMAVSYTHLTLPTILRV